MTPGKAFDGRKLPDLMDSDVEKQNPVDAVTTHKARDDANNQIWLESKGIRSAIILNDYRTQEKDPNKQPWIRLMENRWKG